MSDLKLYEVTNEIADLLESDDPMALVTLEQRLPVFSEKAAAVAHWIQYTEDRAKTLRARAAAFTEAARAVENNAERNKEYLKRCMEEVGALNIKDARTGTVIRIDRNGGKLPLLIEDEEWLRELGYTKEPEPPPLDKDAIRNALDRGEIVVGARYGERGTHLVIK